LTTAALSSPEPGRAPCRIHHAEPRCPLSNQARSGHQHGGNRLMKRLLIEEGLPFDAINEASHREKSGNSPDHPRRMHLWWERRPLAMSRAIVLGSLVTDPGNEVARREVFRSIEACSLFKETSVSSRIEPLRELIRRAFPDEPPRVLDCF